MNNKKWMAILLGGIMAASLAAPWDQAGNICLGGFQFQGEQRIQFV